jgi:predicted site-specific integrase-resolvase
MVTTRPNVDPDGLYNLTEAARALGVHRTTLMRYADDGCIKFKVRRANKRRVTTGAQILKCWETQYL